MMATPKPFLLLGLVALTGCGKWADDLFCDSAGCGWGPGEWQRVASLANPGDPPPDMSNAYDFMRDPDARALGQMFFFDTAFSGNATQLDAIRRTSPPARVPKGQPLSISCATCHDPAHAGADITSVPGHVSVGAGWTDVNALPVVNSAYRQVVFWNGRADSLWALNVIVGESSTTMNGNRLRTAHRLIDHYTLPQSLLIAFQQKFGPDYTWDQLTAALMDLESTPADGKPGSTMGCQPGDMNEPFGDAFDCLTGPQRDAVTTLLVFWAKAIAAYEAGLISVNSPFDQFVTAGPDSSDYPGAAKRGARLFVGKGGCIDCHNGPQLTDEQFHNIGVPQAGVAVPTTDDCPSGNTNCDCSMGSTTPCAPWGAYDGLKKLGASSWRRTGAWSDNKNDTSRQAYVDRALTPDLKGAWRTPSLRNVALTAPYMHDGRYATLGDVVWHYNTGGRDAGGEQVGVPAAEIKPLMLTGSEMADLVAFLQSLTGVP